VVAACSEDRAAATESADAMRRPDSSRSAIAERWRRSGAGRGEAGHGGSGECRESGIVVGRTGVDQHRLAAALDDAAFLEIREHPHANRLQQIGDVRVGERQPGGITLPKQCRPWLHDLAKI
jgi:hypothetical protein